MKRLLCTIMASLCMTFIPMVMMAYDCEVGGIFYNLDTNAKTAEVTYEEISYKSSEFFIIFNDQDISHNFQISKDIIAKEKGCLTFETAHR